ncbi:Gfo/Idh/MocA family oxidoreductase [candidate division KSB1 bacterium]|nr:Gfo/Idh/MocA family oxidoreductase [candidate division KSB1 bacterium]
MKRKPESIERRNFLKRTGSAAMGTLFAGSLSSIAALASPDKKLRVALVGTGIRGTSFWGRTLVKNYSDMLEFVGLCDINPGRLQYGKKFMGVGCSTYTDFDKMLAEAKPELLIVTTVDATHHEFIVKGLNQGIDVLTEKPLTTDENKCQAIIDAEAKSQKMVKVGFNYRYNPHYTKIKQLLTDKRVGEITSVDFHWYLNTYHGASYFRRWHGIQERSGTLLVHKATHHFDLLNWWVNSEPEEVVAYGSLQHYGKNNAFRGDKCRTCPHQKTCKFYWDITTDQRCMDLYATNEHHDGYIRDNCLWRKEIDIYDKMAVQIKYANGVNVSYSLTTYSPYEGMRIAFNGFDGRIDAWDGIPWRKDEKLTQAELHTHEMSQTDQDEAANYEEIMVSDNFGDYELIKVLKDMGGHGGGDKRLQDQIFRNPNIPDPLGHAAGLRDGVMSILIGIAARTSIEEKRPVKIASLTSLEPRPVRS